MDSTDAVNFKIIQIYQQIYEKVLSKTWKREANGNKIQIRQQFGQRGK